MKGFRIFSALVFLAMLVTFVPASAAPETAPAAEPAAPTAAVARNPFSAGPSYDSGWRKIAQGETISMWHQLGGVITNYFVDLQARRYSPGVTGISNRFIGGNDQSGSEDRQGVYWHNLTGNYVSVTRQPEDTLVDAVRVRIWVADGGADWSFGWTAIEPGHYQSFSFPVIANNPIENYVVDVMFNDTGTLGINQRAYGGRTLGIESMNFDPGARVGAYWYDLGIGGVKVYRMLEDEYADQVWVRVWSRQLPTYDSGWFAMNPNTSHIFTHNIGGNPEDYRVDMEFKSDVSTWGINQCYYGGTDFHEKSPWPGGYENDQMGAYWRNLDYNSISVYRLPEDAACADQVRIRIWNFWTPTRPNYDSGWKPVNPGTSNLFPTNLGGDPDSFLIDLQFKDNSPLFGIGIHQRALGGMDWTAGEEMGGFYQFWTGSPGTNGIILDRREGDTQADSMRARIWQMPKPAFDSGWLGFGSPSTLQCDTTTYTIHCDHNLGADPRDFLVDLQFKNSIGLINNTGYGGYEVTYGLSLDYGHRMGAYWQALDENTITITRRADEPYIELARVRIWTLARPDYDSGMYAIPVGVETNALTHNLGGRVNDYFVNLVFNDPELKLLHQRYYGGSIVTAYPESPNVTGDQVGAYYRRLDSDSVEVYRQMNETAFIDQFRLRLWVERQSVYLPVVKK